MGGRTLNHSIGRGHISEVGGEFVGPTHDKVLALAKELRIHTFPVYNTGDNLY